MGPKAKKQLESQSKNSPAGGRISTPLTNLKPRDGRFEFSDNEFISEDDQEDEEIQDTNENSKQETILPSTSRVVPRGALGKQEVRQDPAKIRPRDRKEVTVDDVTSPRQKSQEKVHPQTLIQQIFTPVFMYQLMIILVCVVLINCLLMFYLTSNIHNTLEEGQKTLTNLKNNLNTLEENISENERLYKDYKRKVEQLDDISSKLDVMQPNIFNKDSFIMAFMILLIIVFALALAVYNLYQRQNNGVLARTGGQTRAKQYGNSMDRHEVLRKIPERPGDLKPGVCIISFDEGRTETHRRILNSANIPNCKVEIYVVRRHEQIPDIPRYTVYLMCTEFSERHVIIEEPGLGLGDLHRTTYDAVLKLGGCLIILYTRDPGSRNLNNQSLYNNKIYCVTKQPELSALEQDGRFFSVYDSLTNHQKKELRNRILENMS